MCDYHPNNWEETLSWTIPADRGRQHFNCMRWAAKGVRYDTSIVTTRSAMESWAGPGNEASYYTVGTKAKYCINCAQEMTI